MGGMKQSGMGRRHGAYGIQKYTESQTIAVQRLLPVSPPMEWNGRRYAQLMTGVLALKRQHAVPALMALRARGAARPFDYDWLVVGSGFGGSVAAHRLTQKGYRVGVLECGRRYEDDDFAESLWNLPRSLWMPRLGLRGTMRISLFKDIAVLSGSGVGGGSLVYSNVLYRPPDEFFDLPQWAGLEDWRAALAPCYDEAERMLGVETYLREGPADALMRRVAVDMGVGDTYRKPPVGVYMGEPGVSVEDPYFGGEGPARTGCTLCGSCMAGCRDGAKNTLPKNYLWFAERDGARIFADREVTDIRPLGSSADGSEGYAVTSQRPGPWPWRRRRVQTARGVVISSGALGTNKLLQRCRLNGSLTALSPRLGESVRTNSESVLAVTAPDDRLRLQRSGVDHIEHLSRPHHAHRTGHLRPRRRRDEPDVHGAGEIRPPLHPTAALRRRTRRQARRGAGAALAARLVAAHDADDRDAGDRQLDPAASGPAPARRNGVTEDRDRAGACAAGADPPGPRRRAQYRRTDRRHAAGLVLESAFGTPVTAHFLGGAVIGADAESGVVDSRQRVFGYENLMICDGSVLPANIGVNPSLTITALAEHAIGHVPPAAAE